MVSLRHVVAWVDRLEAVYAEHKAYLTELDSAIGDADHGTNMARGFTAAKAALAEGTSPDIGAALKTVAMTLIKTVGGASGPLYGTFFLKAAGGLAGVHELDGAALERMFADGAAGIAQRGKAEVGDKTMIDAWNPAIEAIKRSRAAGGSIEEMLKVAAEAAAAGRDATIPLVARKGRASYLGERSKDHLDPGATSTTMMIEAARDTFTR